MQLRINWIMRKLKGGGNLISLVKMGVVHKSHSSRNPPPKKKQIFLIKICICLHCARNSSDSDRKGRAVQEFMGPLTKCTCHFAAELAIWGFAALLLDAKVLFWWTDTPAAMQSDKTCHVMNHILAWCHSCCVLCSIFYREGLSF